MMTKPTRTMTTRRTEMKDFDDEYEDKYEDKYEGSGDIESLNGDEQE